MVIKQISLGWKHYLKGGFDTEDKWSFYGSAGWGLMLGRIDNTHSPTIDTASYFVQVLPGKANFKRLTFDLAVGYEKPLGADVYIFMEGRTLVPITNYPSKFIYLNNNAPLTSYIKPGLANIVLMMQKTLMIRQISLYKLSIPLKEPFITSLGRDDFARNVLVKIETSDGITGFGECSPYMAINGESQDTCYTCGRIFCQLV